MGILIQYQDYLDPEGFPPPPFDFVFSSVTPPPTISPIPLWRRGEMGCPVGWVDFGTGMQVGAVVIDNGKKKFFLLFLEFCNGFSLEDLQKNTSKMCENSVVF